MLIIKHAQAFQLLWVNKVTGKVTFFLWLLSLWTQSKNANKATRIAIFSFTLGDLVDVSMYMISDPFECLEFLLCKQMLSSSVPVL